MKHLLGVAATVAATLTGGMAVTTQPANAYQIDCAILLCLSGGWPASVQCATAKAEFVRRITPWPVEPPLQIWRCPMSMAYEVTPMQSSGQRLYEIGFGESVAPVQSTPAFSAETAEPFVHHAPLSKPRSAVLEALTAQDLPRRNLLQRVADYTSENGVADIDISDPAFDFVRSIRVYSVEHLRQLHNIGGDGECGRNSRIRIGRYGAQGDFYWRSTDPSALPDAYTGNEGWGQDCPYIYRRSVFVDWSDYAGNYGYEQVNY